jgi:methylmalonyl-CoA mutase cobalamin-binding subunit
VDSSGREHQSHPRVLLTTTPTEKHALGLLMAECFFALESCERVALGPCTPIPDIVLAVRQLDIDVVALSFSGHASRREVEDSLMQLVEQLPPRTEVWVGGAAALTHRKGLPDRVLVMRRANDVVMQVSAWRMRHGHKRL